MAAVLGVAGIAGLMLAHAQETGASSMTTRKNPLAISPELAAELQAVEQLPTVDPSTVPYGGRGGTYYSAQCPYWPCLPGNIFNLPVWNMGNGYYLIDDLNIDYAAYDTAATTMSLMAKPMGGGFSPMDQTQSGVPYLTIAQAGTNAVLVTVWNDVGPTNYDIQTSPVLTSPSWTGATNGFTGQTNFLLNFGPYYTAFFRAIMDTNNIPWWQAADPNNPSAGILTVFIDSPANGAVIQ
jgi:hypothetical protein